MNIYKKTIIYVEAAKKLNIDQKKLVYNYARKFFNINHDIDTEFIENKKILSGIRIVYDDKEIDLSLDSLIQESFTKNLFDKNSNKIDSGLYSKMLKQKKKEYKCIGHVIKIENVVVFAKGLKEVSLGEMVSFPRTKIKGFVLDLKRDKTGIVILGDISKLKAKDKVVGIKKQLSVKASQDLIGCHLNGLGENKGRKKIFSNQAQEMEIEEIAPSVMERSKINEPLQTGITAIDSMIPIGRGQRQLIIGDRQTGKTSIALDTIINQKNQDIICIYVAIGQQATKTIQVKNFLKKNDALDYTIIVSADASDSAAFQYLAPYTGVAIAEFFAKKGKDVLIVYDDLIKHAWAYREISLLLKRPPGREAYPGDIFYLHSRLLERAGQFGENYKNGSITALPIVETNENNVSAYIPTNIISITDGQIYLETDLFNSGVKPAINVGLSVSRVGGDAQIKAMKQVAGKLRLELAQYRELASFDQFSSELDPETKKKLNRGAMLAEILKQDLSYTLTVSEQICLLYVAINEYLKDIPINQIDSWKSKYIKMLRNNYFDLLKKIGEKKVLEPKIEEELKETSKFFQEYIKK